MRLFQNGSRLHGIGYPDQSLTAYTESYDTLDFGLTVRRYFNTRYQNPVVPMSFIPYNFRRNYAQVSFGFSDINSEFDFPGARINSKVRRSQIGLAWEGLYHFEKMFIGENLMYNKFTVDDFDSDEWSDKVFSFGGAFGYHNTKLKPGLNLQYHTITMTKYNVDEDKDCTEIYPFIEYLPTPTMLISTGLTYVNNSGSDDNDELRCDIVVNRYLSFEPFYIDAMHISRDLPAIQP